MAIRPPRKQISMPMVVPNNTMLNMLMDIPLPEKKNRHRAAVLMRPTMNARTLRRPCKNLSVSQPQQTAPKIPNRAFTETICDASTKVNPFTSCRNSTPHPLTAYRATYIQALDRASIHTSGFRTAVRCIFRVERALCSSLFSSPVRTSIGGRPLDSGESCNKAMIMAIPMAPATAEPANPQCQPHSPTIAPTNRNEKNSPRL